MIVGPRDNRPRMWRVTRDMLLAYLGAQLPRLASDQVARLTDQAMARVGEDAEAVRQALIAAGREMGVSLDENARALANHIVEFTQSASNRLQESLPDLSDLIPSQGNGTLTDPEQEAQVGERRGRMGDRRTPGPTTPAPTTEAPDQDMELAISNGYGNPVSKETQISHYPTLTYGLQETHTTILPWLGQCCAMNLLHAKGAKLELRMNSIYDFFKTPLFTVAGTDGLLPRFVNRTIYHNGSSVQNGETAYMMLDTATTAERPQWRDYWANIYTHYTVLGCEWTIKMLNTNREANQGIEAAIQYDSYSATSGELGNVMPICPLIEAKNFKNIKWVYVHSQDSRGHEPNMKTISGRWRPGMVKHNIINDGDQKTWTRCGGAESGIPSNTDTLAIHFYKAEMNPWSNGSGVTKKERTWVNLTIELKWIVQFKDPREHAIYPNSTNTANSVQLTINSGDTDYVKQYPRGNKLDPFTAAT